MIGELVESNCNLTTENFPLSFWRQSARYAVPTQSNSVARGVYYDQSHVYSPRCVTNGPPLIRRRIIQIGARRAESSIPCCLLFTLQTSSLTSRTVSTSIQADALAVPSSAFSTHYFRVDSLHPSIITIITTTMDVRCFTLKKWADITDETRN